MKKAILTISTTCILIWNVSAQGSWKMIYHNDAEGNRVAGNIEDLIQAVRDGEVVRMAWWSQHPTDKKRKVEHLAETTFLTIMSDSIVFGQIRPIYGQTPDFVEAKITLKENLEWVSIGGTNGKSDSMMRNTVTGEILGHRSRNTARKWYIRD